MFGLLVLLWQVVVSSTWSVSFWAEAFAERAENHFDASTTKHRYRKPYLYIVLVFRAMFGLLVSVRQLVIKSTWSVSFWAEAFAEQWSNSESEIGMLSATMHTWCVRWAFVMKIPYGNGDVSWVFCRTHWKPLMPVLVKDTFPAICISSVWLRPCTYGRPCWGARLQARFVKTSAGSIKRVILTWKKLWRLAWLNTQVAVLKCCSNEELVSHSPLQTVVST